MGSDMDRLLAELLTQQTSGGQFIKMSVLLAHYCASECESPAVALQSLLCVAAHLSDQIHRAANTTSATAEALADVPRDPEMDALLSLAIEIGHRQQADDAKKRTRN